ncbi:MAG: DUF489 family protein [Pseudomonadales bacterium]|nr:DUF489 family protein [Pseudomonadales bacterium]
MNLNRSDERALAFAGLLQACHLVTGLARTGMISQDSLVGSLESVFVTNPETTLDVYATGNGVRTGLRLIMEIIGDLNFSEHGDTIRYVLAVIALEKRLRLNPEVLQAIGAGISNIQEHRIVQGLSVADEACVNRLSELYEGTAGRSEPRIRVQGQQKHLTNRANQARIRALLMAALRSAVLWRQLDGRLSQCVLGRGKLLKSTYRAQTILN